MHEVQVGSTLQQQSIKSHSPGTEPESVLPYKSNGTEQGDALYATLDLAIFFNEPFRGGLEQYGRKTVKLLNGDIFNIETNRNKLKTVKSCNELVQDEQSNT